MVVESLRGLDTSCDFGCGGRPSNLGKSDANLIRWSFAIRGG